MGERRIVWVSICGVSEGLGRQRMGDEGLGDESLGGEVNIWGKRIYGVSEYMEKANIWGKLMV